MKKEYRTDIEALNSLRDKWPSAFVSRTELDKFTGGILHGRTEANRESRPGVDSIPRFRMGKKIFYQVDDIVEYLKRKVER